MGQAENLWPEIYEKHSLDSEGDVSADEGLDLFDRQFIVPDFVLYPGVDMSQKDANWAGWPNYDYIIEIAGAYGVGLINDWQSWYRVNSVAFKELAYKILGLWEQTYFVVPDDEDIPMAVRRDPHYVVVSPTQLDADFDELNEVISI